VQFYEIQAYKQHDCVLTQRGKMCDALDDSYWHNSNQTETVGHKLSMDNSCPALFDD